MDQLDLANVIMSPYAEHRQTCSFERVILYSGWLIYDTRRVRYLPEQVVHVPRPPEKDALDEIAAEQEGKHEYLDLAGMLGSIKDHVYSIMISGVVA
uniref:Uncharacterized protein n=1 Tax=Medicago truncatula TaxID=3880 RepID=A2Q3N3_MEDTR|nr:hypothetical protein MtrDRAFT_AC155886g11v2 [Medicago truncatula]